MYLFSGLLAVMITVVSCQKHTYDFTSSPSNPKAGQKVTFTNTSDAGENWVWTFGDGSKSTLKNPTHVYTTAGSYMVKLQADSNKTRIASHMIEVLDSIPTLEVSSEIVPQYSYVTFKASYYNPSNTTVNFEWSVNAELFVITEGSLSSDSLTGYYTYYGDTTTVGLNITISGKTIELSRTLTLVDNEAPSLYMRSSDGVVWRQRIYDGIYEAARRYRGAAEVVDPANDSTAELNGVIYNIHDMPVLADKQINALQVDGINRKLYLIMDDGLYVANANGDALTRIVETEALTLLIYPELNTLYWSDSEGVKAMPLVTNPQNIIGEQLIAKIHEVNNVPEVERMVIGE